MIILHKLGKFIGGVLLLAAFFIGGMYYHRSTTETITLRPDVSFTVDSAILTKPPDGDSIVYRTERDTVYSRDTVKIYKDYFKTRTYDLQFAEHEAEGSATVSENRLDSISIDNIKAKDPESGLSLEAGLNVNTELQLSPVLEIRKDRHLVGAGYNLAEGRMFLSYRYSFN